jgi:hypothetical protein
MSPRDKDRRKLTGRNIGIATAGAGLLIVSIAALISNIGSGSDIPSGGASVVRIDLVAARDIGALPARSGFLSIAGNSSRALVTPPTTAPWADGTSRQSGLRATGW